MASMYSRLNSVNLQQPSSNDRQIGAIWIVYGRLIRQHCVRKHASMNKMVYWLDCRFFLSNGAPSWICMGKAFRIGIVYCQERTFIAPPNAQHTHTQTSSRRARSTNTCMRMVSGIMWVDGEVIYCYE